VDELIPLADAVIVAMLPGNYGGDALAALVSGRENFSAKLPFTYPKYSNKHGVYDYKVSEQQETMLGSYGYNADMVVQWPFGHGLSYTTFEYSDMSVDKTEFKSDDVIKVTVDVKNTGNVAGKESVLLFSSDHYASCVPDNKRLRDFTKVSLAPGETVTVSFELPAKDLAFVNSVGKWTLEEGDFTLSIGGQNADVRCLETVLWEQPNID
jgi:beta-glucosidase